MKRLAAVAILGLWAAAAHAQCRSNPLTVALLTTGGTSAGSVTVSNDSTNIYVMFTTTGDFTISQLDVAVGATVSNLQPDPSQFPFHQSFCPTVTSFTFTIPIPPGTIPGASTVAIAAHAALKSPTQGSQQAWGSGQLFPGEKACSSGCECDDDGDDDGGHHGDSARHPGDNGGDGGGDHHCGGDRSHRAARLIPGSALNDGGGDGGGDHHCGDDHGDRARRRQAAHLAAALHDGGGQQCGGHGDSQGSVLNHDGGGEGDGHGDDDEEGGQNCGAMYFTYTVQCILNE